MTTKLAPLTLTLTILIMFTGIAIAQDSADVTDLRRGWVPVSGTGIHYFSTAVVHSSEPTDTGFVQRSTDTVELSGDLTGRVLYHPVSVFDFQAGTLVNTGSQVFSGSVLGSAPVLLHDDEFRFEVNLDTGETIGEIHLVDRIAGPRIRCHLEVRGTGRMTPEGDAIGDYSGECRTELSGECHPRT